MPTKATYHRDEMKQIEQVRLVKYKYLYILYFGISNQFKILINIASFSNMNLLYMSIASPMLAFILLTIFQLYIG